MAVEKGKWFRVSLRLMGGLLPVEEIALKLGIAAKVAKKKDEFVKDHKLEKSLWVAERLTEAKNINFEEQIVMWLEKLEPKKKELNEILSLEDVEGELFLGFGADNGQGGAYFSPQLLKRVSDLGLALSLDLYPPSDFENDD